MAIADGVAGVVSGALNSGGVAAPDLSSLFSTIANAGENQRELIGQLTPELQAQYAQYVAANNQTGQALTTGTQAATSALTAGTNANFDPAVAQAAEDAAKTKIYAAVPGQQDAVREALAATGGFDRGTAAKQLAAPVLQAGQATAQNVLSTEAQQLQAKQQATQQALTTIASMDDTTLMAQFGMSKEQAAQILNGNRQDLKDQLTQLINQSNTQTGQTVSLQQQQIQDQYTQQVAQKAQQDAMNGAIVGLGADVATGGAAAAPGFLSGLSTTSGSYNPNAYTDESQLPG